MRKAGGLVPRPPPPQRVCALGQWAAWRPERMRAGLGSVHEPFTSTIWNSGRLHALFTFQEEGIA